MATIIFRGRVAIDMEFVRGIYCSQMHTIKGDLFHEVGKI